MQNPNVRMTLEEAVQEVQTLLHGLDLNLVPEYDRFYVITRQLNRALRANSLELEWSYYSDMEDVGRVAPGTREFQLRSSIRPRITQDDAVLLVDKVGKPRRWAYILPRDSIFKYEGREGLWAAVTRDTITFSRPLTHSEAALNIRVPVMRAPRMFDLPPRPTDPAATVTEVPREILDQLVDFEVPDMIVLRAAVYDAETNPVLQPRVQTLDERYKDLMYQLKSRDEAKTDSPYVNDFIVPIQSDIYGAGSVMNHSHPHSDERWR